MEQGTRRSGLDRRQQEIEVATEKRTSNERRIAISDAARIVEFMKNIPLFKGFSDDQYLKFLNICTHKTVKKDNFLCNEGEDADELFVLVKGKFKVLFRGSILVNFISPMGLVGGDRGIHQCEAFGVRSRAHRQHGAQYPQERAVLAHETRYIAQPAPPPQRHPRSCGKAPRGKPDHRGAPEQEEHDGAVKRASLMARPKPISSFSPKGNPT